ncbi:MAG TPA: TPM domain-containing protein [Candidatus Binatia bacterium]|nr:TPM domain-containing protein [Candidatus Binatia bacterium]
MDLRRLWRHLASSPRSMGRAFPDEVLKGIEEATRAAEARAGGEIRFALEHALGGSALWRGQPARERAIEVFAQLRLWDTARNDGVLIYLLWADRDVEIVADRGLATVPAAEWERCCRIMEQHFRGGRFREGAIAGLVAVGELVAAHRGGVPDAGNELPDAPALL